MAKKIVRIKHDPDPINTLVENDGMWSLESFTREDSGSLKNVASTWNYLNDEDQFGNQKVQTWLRNKFRVGFAWWLRFRDYGGGWPGAKWSILGNEPAWTQFRVGMQMGYPDGILIWRHKPGDMGAKTVDERRKDAQGTLDEYNAYLNNWCWGFEVLDQDGNDLPDDMASCWGFFVTEHDKGEAAEAMAMYINDHLDAHDRVKIECIEGEDWDDLAQHLKAVVLDEDEWDAYVEPEPEYSI